MRITSWMKLSLVVGLLTQSLVLSAQAQSEKFKVISLGNPKDVKTVSEPLFVLMGGGNLDQQAIRQLIDNAHGGDVVVLRAIEDSWLGEAIFSQGGMNSVRSLVLPSRDSAFDPEAVKVLDSAEAIFIAGGDQARYHNYWKNTPIEDKINELIKRGVPIGGTSAGLAVMGEYYFAALDGGITFREALLNPRSPHITIEDKFIKIPSLLSIVTDSHFQERNRMGRLLAFIANASVKYNTPIRGLGVNEGTSFVIDGNGKYWVSGSGSVFLVRPLLDREYQVEHNVPLRMQFYVVKMKAGRLIDKRYYLEAVDGDIISSVGTIY